MGSVALYRRYRPQTFEEVVGQQHVTATLQAQLREGRIGHAFMFSGPRGTGKTTTARLLAKALNCEKGPTSTPCGTCDSCAAIAAGHSLDVIEIDAASHGGVDDVRELRENAVLAPASSNKKVYIVDEAHMVSTAGWNAFLKTVEEPPGHIVFVFATTEPHKVLPTIVSRCQRFDFRRVSQAAIADHLSVVCEQEGIEVEEGALHLIARSAEGGVRDALSTLDQLAATGSITTADAARLVGASTGDTMFSFVEACAAGDTGAAVRIVAGLVDAGTDLRVFARGVLEHARALLLAKSVPDADELLDVTEETRARYASQADVFTAARLVHLIRLFADALADMREQTSPRLAVELAVVRATVPEVDDSATAAIARIERLERVFEAGSPVATTPEPAARPAAEAAEPAAVAKTAPKPAAKKKGAPKEKPAPAKAAEPAAAEPAAAESAATVGSVDAGKLQQNWTLVLEAVRSKSKALHALLADVRIGRLEAGVLSLETRYPIHAERLKEPKFAKALTESIQEVLGVRLAIRAEARARDEEAAEAAAAEGSSDPLEIVRAGFGDDVVEES